MAADFRCGYVAIVGRPNVGKSTLLNRLVGERISITSKKAQTTRHRVTGIVTTPDAQFVFVDTPGFQTKHRSRLNDRMNRAVTQCLADVDADARGHRGRTHDRRRPRGDPPAAQGRRRRSSPLNKVDRLKDHDALLPQMAELAALFAFAAIVPVSAEKRRAFDALLAEVRALLPVGAAIFAADEITDRDERFLAAEFVREKIFRLLGEEVPYATTVAIERFEHEGELRRIHATIHVDRENQRAILLGAGGAKMKEIASPPASDMERLFGGQGLPRGLGARHARLGRRRRAAQALRILRPRTTSMATRAQPLRRDDQPAFVLHTYAYRETSVIVEAFTAEYGRVAMVARGARRPRSELRGLLQGFQPLLLSWSGQQELKTLLHAEWRGGLPLGSAVRRSSAAST